jgi:hypothetical protein
MYIIHCLSVDGHPLNIMTYFVQHAANFLHPEIYGVCLFIVMSQAIFLLIFDQVKEKNNIIFDII